MPTGDSDAAEPVAPRGQWARRSHLCLTAVGGWRRYGTAALLGALGAAALPPVYLVVMLVPSFVGLLWLIESSRSVKAAAAAGWWFGVGHFAAGFYWVAHSFLVDAARYGWMAPFAIFGMAAGLAIFPAIAAAICRWSFSAGRPPPVARMLIFAAAWTALEWLRGWAFTGLPWNLVGTVWTFSEAISQSVAFIGVYGLSLLSVLAAVSPASLAEDAGGRNNAAPAIVAVAAIAVIWTAGALRLQAGDPGTVEGVRLRLVQPNIPQHLKWKPDLRAGHVRHLLELSLKPAESGPAPTHIIWPETAVPFDLSSTPGLLSALGTAAPAGGLLITGAPRSTPPGSDAPKVWNSLHAVTPDGRLAATYDKVRLVPFGEYVPLRGVLSFGKLTAGRRDFSPGTKGHTLVLKGLPPMAALICFEIIFPGEIVDPGRRPEWILNLTNDAWFGQSAGPYQHLATARLRAIEQGLPVVRVANTGISGIIDAYGRMVDQLALGDEGILDADLPAGLDHAPPYGRFGDWITGLIFILVSGLAMIMTRRAKER